MCRGFGGLYFKSGLIKWSEPDSNGDCSHSKTIKRLGIQENADPFIRDFVRFQFKDWKPESFELDEQKTLPGWVDEEEIKNKCIKLLERVSPFWAEYEKVHDAAALAEYEKVRDAAAWAEYKKVRDAALAEYERVRDAALAEYEKVHDAALAEYEKVRDAAAWAEYKKVRDAAWAEYKKVRDAAWAEYKKVHDAALAEFIASISHIDGYVAARE